MYFLSGNGSLDEEGDFNILAAIGGVGWGRDVGTSVGPLGYFI